MAPLKKAVTGNRNANPGKSTNLLVRQLSQPVAQPTSKQSKVKGPKAIAKGQKDAP